MYTKLHSCFDAARQTAYVC